MTAPWCRGFRGPLRQMMLRFDQTNERRGGWRAGGWRRALLPDCAFDVLLNTLHIIINASSGTRVSRSGKNLKGGQTYGKKREKNE